MNSGSFIREVGVIAIISIWLAPSSALSQPSDSRLEGSDLPVMVVDADRGIPPAARVPVTLTVLRAAGSGSNVIEFRGKAEMWVRGNSSRNYAKRPYRIELQDDNGDDLKAPLLGMPKEPDWILLASYTDKTLVRDRLAHELWRQMGYYAPRTRYVELYVVRNGERGVRSEEILQKGAKDAKEGEENVQPSTLNAQLSTLKTQLSTNDYEGVYILVEKIKRGKDRLNVAKLTRSDNSEPKITGGYIFKKDRVEPGEVGFNSSRGLRFVHEEPKERDITPEQSGWLTNFINEFEAVLHGNRIADPESGYAKYIDVDSFIDYHWMTEVGRNVDGYFFSQFFHKDRGGKLRAGPIWDYDVAFGNTFLANSGKTAGWRWDTIKSKNYDWYGRLFEDPDFLQRYIDRWSVLRTNVFATSNIHAIIDRFADELKHAQARNHERWNTIGRRVHPNANAFNSYDKEVNYLRKWIQARLEWIDSQDFPKPAMVVDKTEGSEGHKDLGNVQRSTFNAQPRRVGTQTLSSEAEIRARQSLAPPEGRPTVVRMACLVGKIFYTTDGTDPRVSGGAVSEKALEYKEPIPVTSGLKLFARVRSDYGLWSAPVVYGGD